MKIYKTLKSAVFKGARSLGYEIRRRSPKSLPHYLELDSDYAETIHTVRDFTMTSPERIAALMDAIRYIVRANIPGAIVECGVWRGGSMMAAALTLLDLNEERDLYLFDTFAGMTEPCDIDVDKCGFSAKNEYINSMAADHNEWCYAHLEDVRKNLRSTRYPEERCHFIQGDVLKTLPYQKLGAIALLRLDTDWYDSTLHELQALYPKLSPKGVIIIDDYGHWEGCKKAVHEYFGSNAPLLIAVDAAGRIAIKTD